MNFQQEVRTMDRFREVWEQIINKFKEVINILLGIFDIFKKPEEEAE